MKECVGSLDPVKLVATEVEQVFREKPAIHRLPAKMAERVQGLSAHVRDEYGGKAERVWTDAKDGRQLRANLEGLPGFGGMKVSSLGAALAKRYKVAKARSLVPPHPTLGDVDPPPALPDYQAAKREAQAAGSK